MDTDTAWGWANVKTYGATGDGHTDDTAAIQAAFTATRGTVVFPVGDYRITSTLLVTEQQGLIVTGSGPSLRAGHGTRLWWEGNADDPLLRLWGVRDSLFERFAILSSSRFPLRVALRSETKPQPWGTTGNTFRQLVINGTGTDGLIKGFEFLAGSGGNNNNDHMAFDDLIVANYMDTAFDFLHSQSAAHCFTNVRCAGYRAGPASTGVRAGPGTYFTFRGGAGSGNAHADFQLAGANQPTLLQGVISENSSKFLLTSVRPFSLAPLLIQALYFNTNALGPDHRVLDIQWRGPVILEGIDIAGRPDCPAELYFNAEPNGNYAYVVLGAQITTALANPFTGQPPGVKLGVFLVGAQGRSLYVPNRIANLDALSGSPATRLQGCNLRGRATFGTAPALSVSFVDVAGFPTPEPDAQYYVTLSVSANEQVWVTHKTSTGFLVHSSNPLSAATIEWHLIR